MLNLFLLCFVIAATLSLHTNSFALSERDEQQLAVEDCRNGLIKIGARVEGDYAVSSQTLRGSFIHRNSVNADAISDVVTITTESGSFRIGPGGNCTPTKENIYELLANRIHGLDKTVISNEFPKVTTQDVLDALNKCKKIDKEVLKGALVTAEKYFTGLATGSTKPTVK